MGNRFYVSYDPSFENYNFEVIDSHDGESVQSFNYESDAFAYCDHLNENDY